MNHSSLCRLVTSSLLLVGTFAHAADPRVTIVALDSRLAKIGAPQVEGTETLAGRTVPILYFGNRKMNGNYDLVDAVRKDLGAVATLFVRDGNEFVRVSTNALTSEGRRAVGTTLARNKAYEAVSQGKSFCGVIDVLGTSLDSCYNPVNDATGKLIAVSYVGHKNKTPGSVP